MKHFNCFVRYEDANKSYSIFIQIPENIMNSYDPDSIRKKINSEIAERHYGDGNFAKIVDVKVLGCYENQS